MPLCFGAATKFSQLHLETDKTYEPTVRLGVNTTTADAEGEVVQIRPVACSVGQVVEVLDRFTGPIRQVPPMYSALKKDGKALYEYARAGETVERPARDVVIHDLELLDMALTGEAPYLKLRVHCSKGTYIRTLGEDIANALSCGGHLTMLRRVQTGPFTADHCITLQTLEAMDEAERIAALLPVERLLTTHTSVTLEAEDAGRFLSGMRRRVPQPDCEAVAVHGRNPDALLGTARIVAGELIPARLLTPVEIAQTLNQGAQYFST